MVTGDGYRGRDQVVRLQNCFIHFMQEADGLCKST